MWNLTPKICLRMIIGLVLCHHISCGLTDNCEYPHPLPHGIVTGLKHGDFIPGVEARVLCEPGFKIRGNEFILCEEGGVWKHEFGVCEEVVCDPPAPTAHGTISELQTVNFTIFPYGFEITYVCDEGYRLTAGDSWRACSESGWSGKMPRCEEGQSDTDSRLLERYILLRDIIEKREAQRKEFQELRKEQNSWWRNGVFSRGRLLASDSPGRVVLYFVFDVSGSISLASFKKSISFAKAIVRKVGITTDGVRAGAVTFSSKASQMFFPMSYNSTEHVLSALEEIEYTGGGSAANPALEIIRVESMPLVEHFFSDVAKSIIFILTDGKINMAGNPRWEANKLKKEGVEIYSIGITGDVRGKTLYDMASTSKYGKELSRNVFILNNYRNLEWLVQDIVVGTIDYSECGLGSEDANSEERRKTGGKADIAAWPWMAALYGHPEGITRRHKKLFLCGGSIIHQHFVLTAAICMHDRKGSVRKNDEFRVKLGLTDLRIETHLQEFAIRKIYIHPRYSSANLNCDIALLKLEKPIEYNPFIRPICLPPREIAEDNEFYKPQSAAWAVGWGDTRVLPKGSIRESEYSQILKEVNIFIQTPDVCKDSLRDDRMEARFTDSMFCAAEGINPTVCRGDTGGPAMQWQVTEGHLTWTQVGIISWGLGCGLKDEYGFYTNVQKAMPWIEDTIETALKE